MEMGPNTSRTIYLTLLIPLASKKKKARLQERNQILWSSGSMINLLTEQLSRTLSFLWLASELLG